MQNIGCARPGSNDFACLALFHLVAMALKVATHARPGASGQSSRGSAEETWPAWRLLSLKCWNSRAVDQIQMDDLLNHLTRSRARRLAASVISQRSHVGQAG